MAKTNFIKQYQTITKLLDICFPIGYALRHSLKNYGLKDFSSDIVAAFIISLIALPLAMALSIAVGLPPQHGIYTAVIAGLTAALAGGSRVNVSGPTAAFVAALAPIVASYGLRGLIIAECIAGLIIMIMAICRIGKFINYVPYPVVIGFTSGIAVVLTVLSLDDFLGLNINAIESDNINMEFHAKALTIIQHLPYTEWSELAIGLLALSILIFLPRYTTRIPASIIAVIVASIAAIICSTLGIQIITIGSKFTHIIDGITYHGLPPLEYTFHFFTTSNQGLFAWPSFNELRSLLLPAFVIASLAALESLLSATTGDALAKTKSNPNAELIGIGLANILSSCATGIPATGALARTAVNVKNGARSPLASAMHSLFIALYVMFLSPMISYIPMSALSAILLVTAYHMSHYKQFIKVLRYADHGDKFVLILCFLLTVIIDMVAGVTIGVIVALLIFIARVSNMTTITLTNGRTLPSKTKESTEEQVFTSNSIEQNIIYNINGPLLFTTITNTLDRANINHNGSKTIFINMTKVSAIDITAITALEHFIATQTSAGINTIIICDNQNMVSRIQAYIPDVRIVPTVAKAKS